MTAKNTLLPKPEIRAISLVIPTKDRAQSLAATLDAVAQLIVPDETTLQVVIVLDGCTDNSSQVVDRWSVNFEHTVTCLVTGGLGAGGARNAGLEQAKGQWVGFIDDDVIPAPDWLQVHLGFHANQERPFVTLGAMRLPNNRRLPPWNEWEVLSLAARYVALEKGDIEATADDLYTANAMMPLSALQAVGGFDTSLKRAEDVDLGYRLAKSGVKFRFLPKASVAHCPIRTLRSWKNIPVAYAKAHIDMANADFDGDLTAVGGPRLSSMHPLTRIAVAAFSRQKSSTALYCSVAQSVGTIAHWAHLQPVAYAAYSSVYNVLYFATLQRLKLQVMAHESLSNS